MLPSRLGQRGPVKTREICKKLALASESSHEKLPCQELYNKPAR